MKDTGANPGGENSRNAGYQRMLRHALCTEMQLRLRPMMLHALKGPPQTILSALHMMKKSFTAPETADTAANRTRYADWIRDSVAKLADLGDSILPRTLGLAAEREVCDLKALTEEVVHLFRDEAAIASIEFTVTAPDDIESIEGQREELKLALEALLSGVLDRAPPENFLPIRLSREGGMVVWSVAVRKHPQAHNPDESAFELRFDVSPPHSGLAWHVAHGIVTAHGGNVSLENFGADGWSLQVCLPVLR